VVINFEYVMVFATFTTVGLILNHFCHLLDREMLLLVTLFPCLYFQICVLYFSSDRLVQLMTVGNPMRSQPEAPTEVVAGITDGSDCPASTVATASLGMCICDFVCTHMCSVHV